MSNYPKTHRAAKSERLEARVTQEQKELLQRAAELQGQSLTDFVVASAQRAAEATVREHNVITLTARDSRAFAEAILNPGEANEALRTAFARHDHDVTSSDAYHLSTEAT